MKITALLENTRANKELRSAHGLSLYIETDTWKILFDTGPNGLFADNAKRLNIDLSDVDSLVISHGHSDHGGGLRRFLEENSKAKIYIRPTAFEPHSIKALFFQVPIGLDKELQDSGRFVFTDSVHDAGDGLLLFSDIRGDKCLSSAGGKLYKKTLGGLCRDDFLHEHSLLIENGENMILFAGCSHRGIVNIVERAEELAGKQVDAVIAGFHLYNPASGKSESPALIDEVSFALKSHKALYYTCHCTGQKAFLRMKQSLGDRMRYLATGDTVQI